MGFVLTTEQIEEIVNELHDKVQFFDMKGSHANDVVCAQITEVLTLRFGVDGESDKP